MTTKELSPQETVIASISNAITFMMGAGSKVAMREGCNPPSAHLTQ